MSAMRSDMRPEFQSWGVTLPPQGARQVRAKFHRFKLDLGSLRTGELPECRCNNHHCAMSVPADPVQERRGGLNEALPHPGLVFLNNRTPDCFQRFVREPILALVEEVAGVFEVAAAFTRGHLLSAISHQRSGAG